MQRYPKITIVTPSFNQGNFLEETILSVIGQNYPNLEYLIYDGGSSDNSIDIIKKYEDKIDYWISEKDKGQSNAINKGLQKSTGEIINWLNSDDMLMPNTLFLIAEFFEKNPQYDAVSGDLYVIDTKGNLLFEKKLIDLHYLEMIFSSISVPQPATFFKRSALIKTGYLDENLNYNMDLDFFIRMKKAGVKFGRINKPIAKFRLHNLSKTISEFDNKVEKANYFIKKKHFGLEFKNEEKSLVLKILKWLTRFEIYVRKILLRRELIPFRYTKFVKKFPINK